jgi:hypothetical protein
MSAAPRKSTKAKKLCSQFRRPDESPALLIFREANRTDKDQARSRLDLRRPPLLLSPKYMLSKLRRLVGVRRLLKRLTMYSKNRRMICSLKYGRTFGQWRH